MRTEIFIIGGYDVLGSLKVCWISFKAYTILLSEALTRQVAERS